MTAIHRLVEAAQNLGIPVGRWPDPASLSFHLRRLIERYEVDLVIDVGGHHGEYGHLLRREAHFDGDLISFEPAASAFGELSRVASRDRRWRIQQLALGEHAGTATLQHYFHSTLSSLSDPSAFGTTEWHLRPNGAEEVRVERLDAIDIGIDRYFAPILKIDAQGWDVQVLRGATGILPRIVAIQVEVSMVPLYQVAPEFGAMLRELEHLGFVVSGLFPVAHDEDLRAIEFDCVAVRLPSVVGSHPSAGSRPLMR